MNCSRCDSPVNDTARFCESCGTPLMGRDRQERIVHAYLQELAGNIDAAAAEFETMVEEGGEDSASATVRKHLGNLHFRLGHLRRAREHLGRACELQPENATLWHDMAVVQYYAADFDGAIDSLRNALKRDPGLLLAYFWLGNALYHRGDLAGAIKAFRTLIGLHPNFTIARFHLGVIYARQGDKEKAAEEFRRVLLENPEDAAAQFYVST